MKKIISKAILPLASVMMLSAIPLSGTAFACDEAQCGHSRDVDWIGEADPNAPVLVYDENGNIVDYWRSDDRQPFIDYRDCSSHNWETVYKYAWSANGYQVKVYNSRCKKCCRYKYTSWSYNPV